MKISKVSIPAIAVAAALFAGSAAAIVPQGDLNSAVQSAVSPVANIQVTVNGNVATITGYSPKHQDTQAATQAALQIQGVESVVNHMFRSHAGGA